MTNVIPIVGSSLSTNPDRTMSFYINPTVLQRVYSIFLWDLDTGSVPSVPEIDVSHTKSIAEYFFTTPPQVLEMDENFSTTITPAQDGSKFTESYGSIIKNIRLSGTTGIRPNKAAAAAARASQTVAGAAGDAVGGLGLTSVATQAVNPEVTGHDCAMTMRNMFRYYSDSQVQGRTNIVMVWRNTKDDDYWIVEPVNFKLSQSSKSPFSYNYNIMFKTLARFDRALAAVSGVDSQEAIRGDSGFADRMQQTSQTMVRSYYSILANGDIFSNPVSVGAMITPIQRLVSLTSRYSTGGITITENIVAAAITLKTSIINNLNTLVNLPGNTSKRAKRLERDLRRLKVSCDSIIVEKRFRATVKQYYIKKARVTNVYSSPSPLVPGSRSLPNTGGSPTFLGNTPTTTTVAQGVVQNNDDIRMLAQRLLGDARRWQELVVINNLKPPYITPTGAGNTLKPGSAVLFPSVQTQPPQTLIATQNGSNQDYDNIDFRDSTLFVDQTYGRDILLSSNESQGSSELTDLTVNQRGDLATISGIPNVEQAIGIKFATEQGELPRHPFFGARYHIGSKATVSSFNEFRVNTLSTFLSDGRIQEILSLNLNSVGDILTVSASVRLTNGTDYMNTSFALRRF